MSVTIEVRNGVTVVDGEPRALVSADYPYYRDDPGVWADRLRAIRDELGVEVISSYIPWRHHQPDAVTAPDFTGDSHPGRNVVGFLDLCHGLGLKVIAKPGPFIHAETTYGGLPDWVCPSADGAIEPLLDAAGSPSYWADSATHLPGRPLPTPLGAAFLAKVTRWLSAVGKEVLDAATHPDGPVIMMQIANEGLYTNGARSLSAYDYSPSGLAFFRERLLAWYGSVEEYNRTHATDHRRWDEVEPPRAWTGAARPEELQGYADWGRFHADYLAEVYLRWSAAVDCRVPVVVNLNPPTVEELDDWLARVRPESWGDVAYGFTNWMGVVSADPDAQARYVIAAKRAPGPNLEENWGFSELYDRAYADATTSYHQTLLALAAGATGFNVYTGAATSGWSPDLDAAHTMPYPDSAPIAADGSAGVKAPVVRVLADFFALHGVEFLECAPVAGEAFGLYLPYAGIAAWSGPEQAGAPRCGAALRAFHDRMRRAGRDYAVVELESATPDRLAAHGTLTVPGGPFMHRRVQELLAGYLAGGGRIVLDGPEPGLDEDLRPCDILARALGRTVPSPAASPTASGTASGTASDTASPTALDADIDIDTDTDTGSDAGAVRVTRGEADAFLRVHPGRDVQYLTILVQSGNDGPVRVETPYGVVETAGARGGAAVVRLAGGELDDFVVKGLNGFLDSAVPAWIAVGDREVRADLPADLARVGGKVRRIG
ncbi:beta-galactosidase [Streptosporangium sp. NBC_01639]|uniref:beta-galactosidase n=1 Tax=Streptosporangium sp. NBC_01639 TaxID=2975948 RepID=UPI0038656B74|nr:beta-galactosidase [Streptosporangium sp. NBC_01639]